MGENYLLRRFDLNVLFLTQFTVDNKGSLHIHNWYVLVSKVNISIGEVINRYALLQPENVHPNFELGIHVPSQSKFGNADRNRISQVGLQHKEFYSDVRMMLHVFSTFLHRFR